MAERPQKLDVEFVEGTSGRRQFKEAGIRRSASEYLEEAHPTRGKQRPRRKRSVLRFKQHLVPHCELHVPAVGVELRLAAVLPLVQQRPYLGRDMPHEMSSGLAGVPGERGVGGVGRGEGTAGMLAAVGKEGRVAQPHGTRGVIYGELSERHEVRPVIASINRKGAQDINNNTVNVFDLAGGVVVVLRAEDQRHTERLVQTRPEGARESRGAVRFEHVGQPTSRNIDATKFRAAISEAAALKVGTSQMRLVRRSICTCKKSWPERAISSSRKSRLMQPPRREGTGRGREVRQAADGQL